MSEPYVRVEEKAVGTWAVLDRPERRNAIGTVVMETLHALVEQKRRDGEQKPLVLTGTQGWFASGGDIREFGEQPGHEAAAMAERMSGILRSIEELPCLTIAALNGPAIGGGAELSLAFDFRLAAGSAYLRFPEAQLGVTTGWQGAERLARAVGYSRALELLLTGRTISAGEAQNFGLVNAVWADDELEAEVESFLATLARAGHAGLRLKRLLASERRPLTSGLEERAAFAELWDGPQRRAAMQAALPRRHVDLP